MATIRPSHREPPPARAENQRSPRSSRWAGWMLLGAAVVAPWVGAAPTTLPGVRWWLGGTLAAAFLLTVVSRVAARRRLAIPLSALIPSLFLLGCLGWWATQMEPPFATPFGAELWAYFSTSSPVFQWSKPGRLGFFACLILGFLAAIDLGRHGKFRRRLALTLGLNALAIAIYAHGLAWFRFPQLPWLSIPGGPERFNVSFYHYSGPPAALNLAWPLLVFGATTRPGRSNWVLRLVVVAIIGAAFLLWDSAAGKAVALGILGAGIIWKMAADQKWLSPKLVGAAIGMAFLVVGVSQVSVVAKMQSRSPDNWVSAESTLSHSEHRDAEIRTQAVKRGDRLVVSSVPDRPSAWLAASRMARDYPLIGLGPGAWVKRSALYTHNAVVSTFFHYRQYAHHDLLQFAAEWGGAAVVAMLALWAGGLWRGLHRDKNNPGSDSGLVLALLGVALHSAVDFPLQNPAIQIWTALLLGLAWSEARPNPSSVPLKNATRPQPVN